MKAGIACLLFVALSLGVHAGGLRTVEAENEAESAEMQRRMSVHMVLHTTQQMADHLLPESEKCVVAEGNLLDVLKKVKTAADKSIAAEKTAAEAKTASIQRNETAVIAAVEAVRDGKIKVAQKEYKAKEALACDPVKKLKAKLAGAETDYENAQKAQADQKGVVAAAKQVVTEATAKVTADAAAKKDVQVEEQASFDDKVAKEAADRDERVADAAAAQKASNGAADAALSTALALCKSTYDAQYAVTMEEKRMLDKIEGLYCALQKCAVKGTTKSLQDGTAMMSLLETSSKSTLRTSSSAERACVHLKSQWTALVPQAAALHGRYAEAGDAPVTEMSLLEVEAAATAGEVCVAPLQGIKKRVDKILSVKRQEEEACEGTAKTEQEKMRALAEETFAGARKALLKTFQDTKDDLQAAMDKEVKKMDDILKESEAARAAASKAHGDAQKVFDDLAQVTAAKKEAKEQVEDSLSAADDNCEEKKAEALEVKQNKDTAARQHAKNQIDVHKQFAATEVAEIAAARDQKIQLLNDKKALVGDVKVQADKLKLMRLSRRHSAKPDATPTVDIKPARIVRTLKGHCKFSGSMTAITKPADMSDGDFKMAVLQTMARYLGIKNVNDFDRKLTDGGKVSYGIPHLKCSKAYDYAETIQTMGVRACAEGGGAVRACMRVRVCALPRYVFSFFFGQLDS